MRVATDLPMARRRAVVTGLGVVSPVGTGKEEAWLNLVNGCSGSGPITCFDASSFPSRMAAEVDGFDMERFVDDPVIVGLAAERRTQFGVSAAKMAWDDARLDPESLDSDRVAIVTGAGLGIVRLEDIGRCIENGGTFSLEKFALSLPLIHRESILRCPMDLVSGLVSQLLHASGPNYTITSACAAGTQAIGTALRMIQRGDADVALAGAADSMINPMGLMGFILLKATSTNNDCPAQASRPFDRKRDGLVVGEGAGLAVIEELSHARRRGAAIYAELAGYGTSLDAYRVTDPHPEGRGAVQAMVAALSDAGIAPTEVDYINAHGTSTKLNDKVETLAIKQLFGAHAYELTVSSTKSMVGHLMAAAGALEFAATVLSVQQDIVHPTINYEFPDPECDLDYVPNVARRMEVNVALSNSFGFGGQNATLAVRKYRGDGS